MTDDVPPPLPGADPAPTPAPAPEPAPRLSSTCPNCGAQTSYAPGTTSLRCSSCGSLIEIAASQVQIQEHSYDEWMSRYGDVQVASLAAETLRCRNCGATTESTDLSGSCQFCGGALLAVAQPEGLVPPEAVLPFGVDKAGAQQHFGAWVGSRWFAPGALKRIGSTERLTGTYLPHWTFDAHTQSDYRGERGDHYYVTRTRQVPDGKGGSRTETYQEQRTRWSRASGTVARDFDDVLVPGTDRVDAKRLGKMGPWQLTSARPFQAEYLTGYSALRYDVDPKAAAKTARHRMRAVIKQDVESDIGGDEQRIDALDVHYSRAMFKLVLLPLWLATYLYGGRTWQVMVNANTGEVLGDRPYSVPKIVAAVVAALVVIALIVVGVLAAKGSG